MNKQKHLTHDERVIIQHRLTEKASLKAIGRELGKDPTTISKEIRNHIQFKKSGSSGKAYNDCRHRKGCNSQYLCGAKACRRYCNFCSQHRCSFFCDTYQPETCDRLTGAPYVCNGCDKRTLCTLEKRTYSAFHAQKEYEVTRREVRQGLQIDEAEVSRLDAIISPLLRQGQSLHHICINHADALMLDERTLYRYIAQGVFTARNIDMPRVMRMGARKKKKDGFKVDRKCRIGRTYLDFRQFLTENPGLPIVEMDSVMGKAGGKVLLTLHFVVPQLMLAFLRDANTSQSVIDIAGGLYQALGPGSFRKVFQVMLGDNGSEFSNPCALETDSEGNPRTRVFYCDPSSPYQKGAIENNHTLIRRIVPKGTSLDDLTQADVSRMMDHINSYGRPNLGDKTPYAVFAALYGEDLLKKMGAEPISPDLVTLHPSLFKK